MATRGKELLCCSPQTSCGFFSIRSLALHQLVSTVPRQLTVVLTRLKFLEPAGAYAKSLARSLWMSPQCPLYFYPERKTHSVGRRSMFLLFPSISSHEAGIVSQCPVTRYPMPEVQSSTPGRLDR